MGQPTEPRKGIALGLMAYGMWGCFPLFFALFQGIGAGEILIHRILWSCVFLALVITVLRRWSAVRSALTSPLRLWRVLGCAVLIAVNWGLYIYSVETHRVLQASLGYFMTPLVNVALGMLVLKETLSRAQAIAVALAGAGIALQLALLGTLPWISLVLALSFGTYGLLRKQVELDGLSGLFVETLLLAPIALAALTWLVGDGLSHFLQDSRSTALLVASGVITAIPLLAFAGAARRLSLGTLGFLMYINPTLQFFIALWIFGEPLDPVRFATFVLIWFGLALYSFSTWRRQLPSAG
ncbi:EamA family transporter RarD [Halomonas sp. V046]|uniref:EamA family transporter RarD n=1 Tax=Halomonas sp. V046 TaxID=3459611 RepID=UPI00404396DA